MLIIMSVLGAVVMPHNLFLHSEVIQSHEYNKKDDASIKKVLKYELFDTLFSMIVGWAINSAMILLAAATFFKSGIQVEELQTSQITCLNLCWEVMRQSYSHWLLFDGRYFVHYNKRNGGRFYLCRYLWRVISY